MSAIDMLLTCKDVEIQLEMNDVFARGNLLLQI